MGFPARTSGTCIKCLKEIQIGQEITWNRLRRDKIWHVDCGESKAEIPQNGVNHDDIERERLAAKAAAISAEMARQKAEIEKRQAENRRHDPLIPASAHTEPFPGQVVDVTSIKSEPIKPKKSGSNPLEVFIDGIIPLIEERVSGKVDEQTVIDLIAKHAPKSTVLEVKHIERGESVTIQNAHEFLPKLLYFVNHRHHVYLHGPAGSGKSTAARQVAEALKLPWGYISLNPQTPDSRLLGFIDAGGTYRATPFYRTYLEGGVFCIDEMDNASASLLTTLNSMLENGHGAFPDGIHERHSDFVLVATGNTNGRGGNPAHPERRAFDTAFAERFTYLEWNYDETMERTAALAINPDSDKFIRWIWALRRHCQKNHPKIIVSPRATFKGALYIKDLGAVKIQDVLEGLIFKGIDSETTKSILASLETLKI